MNRARLCALVALVAVSCAPTSGGPVSTPSSKVEAKPPVDAATACFGAPGKAWSAPAPPQLPTEFSTVDGTVERIDVRLSGTLDESIVRGLITSKAGEVVDRGKVAEDLRRLFALGNFEDISVTAASSGKGLVLTYVITERPVLANVLIRGVPEDQMPDVEAAAGQHRGDLYLPSSVQASARSVKKHLIDRGHARAKVETFVRRPDERSASLCMQVTPGPVVHVEALNFDGRSQMDAARLEQAIRSAGVDENLPGGFLDLEKLEAQLLYATAAYYDAGMVEVKLGKPEVRYSDDGTLVAIHVPVNEGPVFRVGEVSFGAAMQSNAVRYRAALGFGPGDVFDRSKIMAAVVKLNALRASEGASGDVTPETTIHADKRTIDLTFDAE